MGIIKSIQLEFEMYAELLRLYRQKEQSNPEELPQIREQMVRLRSQLIEYMKELNLPTMEVTIDNERYLFKLRTMNEHITDPETQETKAQITHHVLLSE